jgi:hypothetical protein
MVGGDIKSNRQAVHRRQCPGKGPVRAEQNSQDAGLDREEHLSLKAVEDVFPCAP